jgi:hypothetical protein
VKKDKQLDERICVLFLLNLKSKDVHLILAQILRIDIEVLAGTAFVCIALGCLLFLFFTKA